MKTIRFIAAAAVLCAAVACNSGKPAGATAGADSTGVAAPVAEATTNLKDLLPTKGEIDSVSYLLGTQLGGLIKGYNFAKSMKELNFSQIKQGIVDYVNAKGNQRDPDFGDQFKINPEDVNTLFPAFIEKRRAYTAAENQEKESKFLAANKAKEGVQETASGLQYIIEEAGNDVKPGERDTVFVHYKLSLADGTMIEEVKPEDESVMLQLNRVIPGWTEGMQLIGEGGKAVLYIPAELGYGEQGNQAIAPNSALIFDVEMTKVGKYVEPAAE